MLPPLARFWTPVRQASAVVLDFVYPPICAACDGLAPSGQRWCEQCDAQLAALQAAPACDVCAMPLAEHLAPCPYCEGGGLRPFRRLARLGIYDSPLREMIRRIKYANDWSLAERLADRLAEQDSVRSLLADAGVIVPVPLYGSRQHARGFNQAAVLAGMLGRRSGVKVRPAVLRVRDTPTQTAMHKRAERLENLKNAFVAAHPEWLAGRRVVLVDDVMTTGATLQTLAKEVRRCKPAAISAVALAIADPKGRMFERI